MNSGLRSRFIPETKHEDPHLGELLMSLIHGAQICLDVVDSGGVNMGESPSIKKRLLKRHAPLQRRAIAEDSICRP